MIKSVPFVQLQRQYERFKEEIDNAISRVAASGHYIMGPEVEKFEAEFAAICGTTFAIALGNGTDALVLAMKALGIGPGDEVITAVNSFVASAGAIHACGATAVFADIGQDYNILPESLEAKITPATKAIVPVHLTGRLADMDAINQIADRYDLLVIEDAAQAIGAKKNGVRAGAFGAVGCFSLHPLKNIFIMGDGGVVTTSCPHIYKKIKRLQNHGLITRDVAAHWGENSRFDAIHGAVGLVKLAHFDEITNRFTDIAERYRQGLDSLVGVPRDSENERSVYHNFVIDCDDRDGLVDFLSLHGVETKIHYPILLSKQPAARTPNVQVSEYPNAERLIKRQLSLPIYPELTNNEIDYVIDKIALFYSQHRKFGSKLSG